MAEMEVARLKEALFDLYTELEEEIEASAVAASEALAMILRLEREKAAEKMEASQYKRLTEEKIHHVEDQMADLEDEMQEKEMEISFLKHQLSEYRQKLSLIGVDVDEEEKSNVIIRRNTSLPVFRFSKLQSELEYLDRNSPIARQISKRLNRYVSGSQIAGILDKEVTGTNGTESVQTSCGLDKEVTGTNSTESVQTSCGSTHTRHASEETVFPDSNEVYNSISELEIPETKVHDVFEVPESQGSCNIMKELKNKGAIVSSTEALLLPEETQCPNVKDNNREKNEVAVNNGKKSSSSIASKKDDLDMIKKRLEKLEREKGVKQDKKAGKGEQQLKLLENIYEQLSTIELRMKEIESPKKCQIESPRKKCQNPEDVKYDSIIETFLSISI